MLEIINSSTQTENTTVAPSPESQQAFESQQVQLESQQIQREAIVDLLLLGMHVDRTISLLESDLLESEIASLGWDTFHSSDIYLQRAVPIVRDAIGHVSKQATLLQSIANRLTDNDVKKDAIERFSIMLEIDGTVKSEEQLLDQAMSILLDGSGSY